MTQQTNALTNQQEYFSFFAKGSVITTQHLPAQANDCFKAGNSY